MNRVLNFPTKTQIFLRNQVFRKLDTAFRTVPCRSRVLSAAREGACGGKVRALSSPGLDADEVEERVTARGALPGGVGWTDAFKTDEARKGTSA